MLVRRYGCDLAYTPMIVSESFVLSEKARDVEFTTNDGTKIHVCMTKIAIVKFSDFSVALVDMK